MSTRALIHIYKDAEDKTPLTTIYKHYDGYPTEHGVGQTLKRYITNSRIVNGLNPNKPSGSHDHNGMGCFAASLIDYLKTGPGDVYIEAPGASGLYESYVYTITPGTSIKSNLSLVVESTSDNTSETLVAG